MKLTSMQKMLAVVAIVVVIAIAAVALLIVPKFGELSQLALDREAALAEVQQTQTRVAQLRQSAAKASVTQAELLKLANQFPENPELPSLIMELQDAANSSGIRFTTFGPGKPGTAVDGRYTELPLEVAFTGTWSDMLDYLRRVNHMTRAIRVTSVSLAGQAAPLDPAQASEDMTLSLTLSMRAYVMAVNGQPPVAQSATATAPQP
jgi:type IV pilus assembly protein PilO